LRNALKIVADNNQSDMIVLQEGFYSVVEDGIGQLEYNSTEDYNLTLVGDGNVTLSGYELSRILYIDTEGRVIFSNLNFVDGFGDGKSGGAIYVERGDIEIWDSNFSNNSASGGYSGGGAIYSYGDIEIWDSNFSNNSARYGNGGAIYGDGTVTNSTFSNNSASYGSDGAIYGDVPPIPISNDSASRYDGDGGAIYSSGDIEVTNSIFSNNSADNGGAIYNGSSDISIIGITFSENNSSQQGGAIYSKGRVKLAYSVFSKNSSEDNSTLYFSDNTKNLSMFSNYIDFSKVVGEIDYNASNIQAQDGDTLFDENFTLPADSVLIDKGGELDSGALIYAFGYLSTKSDFHCNERVVNGKIDIGAIEFGGREGNYCDSNYSYLNNNYTDINYSNNITIDTNLTVVCAEGWHLDENRSVCVQDIPNGYDISNIIEVPISQGWSLRAVDINISDIPSDISLLWIYSDGQWFAYSPNGEYTQKIKDKGYEGNFTTLSSQNGVWFKSSRDFNLVLPKPQNEFNNPTPPSLEAPNLDWNLLGSARELPAEVISCKNGDVQFIWKFFQGEWLLYAPDINPSLYDFMFNTILPNEGFWVLCK